MTADVVVTDIVPEAWAEVAVWEPVTEESLPDVIEQELRFWSWRSCLMFVVSNARDILYFQAAPLVFP